MYDFLLENSSKLFDFQKGLLFALFSSQILNSCYRRHLLKVVRKKNLNTFSCAKDARLFYNSDTSVKNQRTFQIIFTSSPRRGICNIKFLI